MCVCCKLKRLMVHYVYPNPFKLRLRTECWSSRSVPLFIKRQASKRGKREEKERERGKKKKGRKEKQATIADPGMSCESTLLLLLLEWLRMWWGVCRRLWGWQCLLCHMMAPSSWARGCCQAEGVWYHVPCTCCTGCASPFAWWSWRVIVGGGNPRPP